MAVRTGALDSRWDVMHNRVQSRGVRTRGFAAHITFKIETCGCCGLIEGRAAPDWRWISANPAVPGEI